MVTELVHKQRRAANGEKDWPLHQTRGTNRSECQRCRRCGMTTAAQSVLHTCRRSLNAADDAADRSTSERPGRRSGRIRGTGNDATSALNNVHH